MKPEQIFSDAEIGDVAKCLRCALLGDPVLSHRHFHTLTGAKVENAVEIVEAWPNVDLSEDITRRTVKGVFNSLWNFPHRQWERVVEETGLSKEEIRAIQLKLRKFYSPPKKQ